MMFEMPANEWSRSVDGGDKSADGKIVNARMPDPHSSLLNLDHGLKKFIEGSTNYL
jgi:hypothetical protein